MRYLIWSWLLFVFMNLNLKQDLKVGILLLLSLFYVFGLHTLYRHTGITKNTNIVKCYVACGTGGFWLLRKGNTEEKQTLRQHISNYCNKCVTRLAKNLILYFTQNFKNLENFNKAKLDCYLHICKQNNVVSLSCIACLLRPVTSLGHQGVKCFLRRAQNS